MTTLADAITAVTTAVTDADLTRGDGQPLTVQSFDPLPGTYDWPAAVAVTFGGMDALNWFVLVRVYCDTGTDVQAAEQLGQTLVPAIDAALESLPVEHTSWEKTWSEGLNAYVFECAFPFGRDDF